MTRRVAFALLLAGFNPLALHAASSFEVVPSVPMPPNPLNFSWIRENEGSAQIAVVRSGDTGGVGTVDYATSDITATAGADYVATSGTLRFGAGEEVKYFTVPIINDSLVEGDEDIAITLSNLSGGVLGVTSVTTLRIMDNDFPTGFALSDYSVVETNGTVTIEVWRGDDGTNTVSVDYATADGSATAGADYIATSGTLTFSGAEKVKSFTVTILDDPFVEGAETVRLTLSHPQGGIVLGDQSSATLHIWDNEIPLSLDPGFQPGPGPNDTVLAMARQSSGKIIIGGYFTNVDGTSRGYLARLNVDGTLDAGFNADNGSGGINGYVATLLVLPEDDSLLIGGNFTLIDGVSRSHIARLKADGALDSSFDPGSGADGFVRCITVQSDGKVLIGGDFYGVGDFLRRHIARLGADGGVDLSFDTGPGLFDYVLSIVVQTNGQIIVGGSDSRLINGVSRTGLARFDPDGWLDASYEPQLAPGSPVNGLALQTDGKLIVVRHFESFLGAPFGEIARLNPDGSLDASFTQFSYWEGLPSVALQADGRILVGVGLRFGAANGSGALRLRSDGTMDSSFNTGSGVNGTVFALVPEPGGGVFIAGDFTSVNGVSRNRVARIFGDDTGLDAVAFAPMIFAVRENETNALVWVQRLGDTSRSITVDYATSDGTATAGADYVATSGTLTFGPLENSKFISVPIVDDGKVEGTETITLNLMNPSGGAMLDSRHSTSVLILDDEIPVGLDPSFHPAVSMNFGVNTLLLQPDGRMLLGGFFNYSYGVTPQNEILRLNPDGSLDETFDAGVGPIVGASVEAMALQPDGKVLIGGSVDSLDATNASGLARLNADGSLDTSFKPALEIKHCVRALALQPNGAVLVGTSNQLFRLSSDGALDAGFIISTTTITSTHELDHQLNAIAVASDGKILIGGEFCTFNGAQRAGIARLNPDGSLDADFHPLIEPSDGEDFIAIHSVLLQANGHILIGGHFGLVGGSIRGGVARLNPDGSLDESFDPGSAVLLGCPIGSTFPGRPSLQYSPCAGTVNNMALGPDGTLLIVGSFDTIRGVPRLSVARLNSDGSVDDTLNLSAEASLGASSRYSGLNAVQVQPDGKVVVAGPSNSTLSSSWANVARFYPNTTSSRVEFADSRFTVGESDGVARITVRRSGDTSGTITIHYTAAAGTATDGLDFVGTDGALTFGPLETTKSFIVQILDDFLEELDETVVLTLDRPSEGVHLGLTQAQLAIIDDDRSGSIDADFIARSVKSDQGYVYISSLALQPDGKLLASGSFIAPDGNPRSLARLNPDGSYDDSFKAALGFAMAVLQPDGKIFTLAGAGVARLNPDGSRDRSFNSSLRWGAGRYISALALQTDGRLLVAGETFETNGYYYGFVARLNQDGSFDPSFTPPGDIDNSVKVVALDAQGRVLIAGTFSMVNGVDRRGIARLNADGSLDMGFDPGAGINTPPATVPPSVIFALPPGAPDTYRSADALAVQPDGRILLGGYFDTFNGIARSCVARINTDGSLDTAFDPGSGAGHEGIYGTAWVFALALQTNGKVIVAGQFSRMNGAPRKGISRLMPDGSVDDSFVPISLDSANVNSSESINALAVLPDGAILAGGDLTYMNGLFDGLVRYRGDFLIHFSTPARRVGESLRFNFTTQPGRTYVTEFSPDLKNWTPQETNIATGTSVTFDRAVGSPGAREFYRAISVNR